SNHAALGADRTRRTRTHLRRQFVPRRARHQDSADHHPRRARTQPRGARRSRRTQSRAENQGHRSRADLPRPPGAPDAQAAGLVMSNATENAKPTPTKLIVVSGMSGSGKTIAMRTLEDLDYY